MAEGLRFLKDQGYEVMAAETLHEAKGIMYAEKKEHPLQTYPGLKYQKPVVHGVITDLFFPYSKTPEYNHPNDPCGLAVLITGMRLGIPTVICTAGFHHGPRYEWIHSTLCGVMLHEVLVDMPPKSQDDWLTEADSKNWAKALKNLESLWTKLQSPADE